MNPRSSILSIAPYIGGERALPGRGPVFRMASNEGALGASSLAIEAAREASSQIHRYPDGHARALREAIGAAHGLDPQRVVCGAGSDELIHLMVLAYAGPGDQVLYSQHGFLVYRIAAQIAGATPIAAPETGLKTDCAALLEAVTPATKIVLLANPNNPTGSYLTYEELKELRLRLPEHVLLGIDAAYAEYAVGAPSYEDGHRLAHEHDNVVMLRTFSKIYGLAGLRVGWAFGSPPVVEILNRIRGPFNVGAGAQAAACAALSDTAHIARARAHNDIYLPWLRTRVLECGLRADPSFGNFLLVQFPKSPELNADSAAAFLKERRILVRKMGAYDLPHCLRITIAEQECVEAAAEALADFVKQAATQ